MSKKAGIILAVAALLIGIVGGGWIVAFYYGRLTGWMVTSNLTSDAVTSVAQVKMLRAGQITNTVELLERRIDGDLIGLTPFLVDRQEFYRNPSNIKALQTVKEYRAKYPRKSESAELDGAADKAFDLLNEPTNH